MDWRSSHRRRVLVATGAFSLFAGALVLVDAVASLPAAAQSAAFIPSTRLSAVACESPDACVAVGSTTVGSGFAATTEDVIVPFTFSDSGVTLGTVLVLPITNPFDTTLAGIACPTSTTCIAVGGNQVVPLTVSGSSVTAGTPEAPVGETNPNVSSYAILDAVACASSSTCVAVGTVRPYFPSSSPDYGSLYDAIVPISVGGSGVTPGAVQQGWQDSVGGFTAVACPGATALQTSNVCVAVGGGIGNAVAPVAVQGATATLGTEQAFGEYGPPNVYQFFGVACPDATDCVAVGYGQGTQSFGAQAVPIQLSGDQIVVTAADGTQNAPTGSSAVYNVPPTGEFDAIACMASAECVAGTGNANNGNGDLVPLLDTSGALVFGAAASQPGIDPWTGVACPATSNACVAVGVVDSNGDAVLLPFSPSGISAGGGPEQLVVSDIFGNGNMATNVPISCSGDPVNCATGNFTETYTDASVPGRGPALDLSRTYNSLGASTPSPFGYGWSDSYEMSLAPDPSGDVTITQQDGATVTFSPNATGGYSAPSYVFATLAHNADGTWTFVRRGTSIFTFSPTGQLRSESDRNGYTTTLAYGPSGQLTTATDQAGRSIGFTYGANGLVSSVADPAGNITHYAYDSSDDLTSVTNPLGATTSFGYSSGHLLTTLTKPDGGVLTNTYDAAGQVTEQVDPLGRTTSFSYGTNATTITEPNGSTTDETFSDYELTARTTAAGTPQAATTTYTYDPSSLSLLTVSDPNGHATTYTYDANGNETSVTDPLGPVTSATFNALDEPLTKTTPMGVSTTYTYDANGNLLSVSTPAPGT
ncbi:MAG: DUF6531 domain-containing protein, partial [Acidimicrobiales bacterium]